MDCFVQKKHRDWFRNWFDENYLRVYAHRNRNEARNFISRWSLWDSIDKGGWCLDIGCGPGRYSHEFAARGMKVLGLDLSMPMLTEAKKISDVNVAESVDSHKSEVKSALNSPFYVRADMRAIPSRGPFSLIVILFTGFGYFDSDREHFDLIQSVAGLLARKGVFVLDVPNPEAVKSKVESNPITEKVVNGIKIKEIRQIKCTPLRVYKCIEIIDRNNHRNEYFESVRLFSFEELNWMLSSAGLKTHLDWWGDYDGSTYKSSSPRMIFFGSIHD